MDRFGVVGCGLTGSGIAEVAARRYLGVVAFEVQHAALDAGRQRIDRSLARAVASGKLSEQERVDALERIIFTTDMADLADRELVIEAVTEDEATKIAVFGRLDAIVEAETAILASNTSSIPIMKLAMATRRPEKVIGLQPRASAPPRGAGLLAAHERRDRRAARTFARDQLGKKVIRSKDRAGFIVNALLIPYILSAVRMLESGFATSEDIDTGMVEGCAHPMGPLALADLIGIDTTQAIAESLYTTVSWATSTERSSSCASTLRRTARWPRSATARAAASPFWPRCACQLDAAVDCYGAFVVDALPEGLKPR